MTAGNAAIVYCANAFSLGVEAIGDPMGTISGPDLCRRFVSVSALRGREGHEDRGEKRSLRFRQRTQLQTIPLLVYTSRMRRGNAGMLLKRRVSAQQCLSIFKAILLSLRKRG